MLELREYPRKSPRIRTYFVYVGTLYRVSTLATRNNTKKIMQKKKTADNSRRILPDHCCYCNCCPCAREQHKTMLINNVKRSRHIPCSLMHLQSVCTGGLGWLAIRRCIVFCIIYTVFFLCAFILYFNAINQVFLPSFCAFASICR